METLTGPAPYLMSLIQQDKFYATPTQFGAIVFLKTEAFQALNAILTRVSELAPLCADVTGIYGPYNQYIDGYYIFSLQLDAGTPLPNVITFGNYANYIVAYATTLLFNNRNEIYNICELPTIPTKGLHIGLILREIITRGRTKTSYLYLSVLSSNNIAAEQAVAAGFREPSLVITTASGTRFNRPMIKLQYFGKVGESTTVTLQKVEELKYYYLQNQQPCSVSFILSKQLVYFLGTTMNDITTTTNGYLSLNSYGDPAVYTLNVYFGPGTTILPLSIYPVPNKVSNTQGLPTTDEYVELVSAVGLEPLLGKVIVSVVGIYLITLSVELTLVLLNIINNKECKALIVAGVNKVLKYLLRALESITLDVPTEYNQRVNGLTFSDLLSVINVSKDKASLSTCTPLFLANLESKLFLVTLVPWANINTATYTSLTLKASYAKEPRFFTNCLGQLDIAKENSLTMRDSLVTERTASPPKKNKGKERVTTPTVKGVPRIVPSSITTKSSSSGEEEIESENEESIE